MFGLSDFRHRATNQTLRILEFNWIHQLIASFTLVTFRPRIPTFRTLSSNISVCQKQIACATVMLFRLYLRNEPILVKIKKNIRHYLLMRCSRRPSKVVKADVEPFVDPPVNLMVFVTDLLRSFLLL